MVTPRTRGELSRNIADHVMPDQRPLQFTLRKLLLWTVVAAVWLGLLKMLRADLVSFAVFASWVVAVGVLRMVFYPTVVATLSAFIGVILGTVLIQLRPTAWFPLDALVIVLSTVAAGLCVFLFVEVALRAVNWADKVIRTKTGE